MIKEQMKKDDWELLAIDNKRDQLVLRRIKTNEEK